MSEARIRSLAQRQSNIFSSSPSSRIRPREIPQTESNIFTPLPYQPKPMSYSREKYNRASICLGQYYDDNNEKANQKSDHSGLSPAGKKTGQCSSTKYLLGNDRSSFYKKSVDDNLGVPSEFQPKYSQDSAFDRKQKEFNDGHSPQREKPERKQIDENLTAKDRKFQDRVSVFDSNAYTAPPKQNNFVSSKPPLYDPGSRKSEILSSEVFEERRVVEYKRTCEADENEEFRRKNHMFSDLFGRPSNVEKGKVVPDREKVDRNTEPYDPRMHAHKVMSSQIDIGDSPKRPHRARTPQISEKPHPREPLSSSQRKQQDLSTSFTSHKAASKAELFDLDLSSVPRNIAASDIKDLCGGIHLVSLSLDIDNFTGNCRGTGKIKLRTNESSDITRLEKVLGSKGIKVEKPQESNGRKNNYHDVVGVSWHNSYDNKRAATPLGARETKMKNLESSVFGEGQKWSGQAVESFDGELSAQMLWKNTKNPRYNY